MGSFWFAPPDRGGQGPSRIDLQSSGLQGWREHSTARITAKCGASLTSSSSSSGSSRIHGRQPLPPARRPRHPRGLYTLFFTEMWERFSSTYLLHSVGELCLSPVGLSSVTELSPPRLVGQMMGTWFLAASLGNLIAGLLAGEFHADAIDQMPRLYLRIVFTTVGAGIVFFIFAKPIKSLMSGVK